MALSQTGHTADLNSIFTLEQIVEDLPMETRDRWVKWKDEIYKPGKRSSFDDLRLFIDSEVRIRQGRIGMPTPVIKVKNCKSQVDWLAEKEMAERPAAHRKNDCLQN